MQFVFNPLVDGLRRLFYSFGAAARHQQVAELASMHLQWFSEEDEGRTEDPTEQRIRKAREDGRFAKSTDLVSAISTLFSIVALALLAPFIWEKLGDMLYYYFTMLSSKEDIVSDRRLYAVFINVFLLSTLPLMLVSMFAGVAGNVVQTGFVFTTKPIQPDFQKITPNFSRWLSRSIGWPEGVFNLLRISLKAIMIIGLSYFLVRSKLSFITSIVNNTIEDSFALILVTALQILVLCTLVMLVFSFIDYLFQRNRYMQSLKMTKHEVKDEFKQTEGDPQVRSRIRNRMRELLASNLIETVPQADVIVTNPTHFAVALQWDNNTMEAPTVTAKGADELAFRIRQIATEHDIPIMENKALARALYADVDIGDIIPENYWEVVSKILAEVYRVKGSGAWQST